MARMRQGFWRCCWFPPFAQGQCRHSACWPRVRHPYRGPIPHRAGRSSRGRPSSETLRGGAPKTVAVVLGPPPPPPARLVLSVLFVFPLLQSPLVARQRSRQPLAPVPLVFQ